MGIHIAQGVGSPCKTSVNTPLFHLQSGEAKRRDIDCSVLQSGRVVSTLHAGSGSSFTRRVEWGRCLAVSEGAQPSIIVEFVFIVIEVGQLLEVESITEDGADTTETLHELVTLRGTVRDEFQGSTEIAVLLCKPLKHG